jgi:ParB family transcriptional regulator, chromosome partitioning protein
VAKRGLPVEIKMRHDSHYVEELAKTHRTVGKILPVSQIEPNPDQPRVEIGDLTELTDSIREKGVLEPLLVKPVRETGNWMIIAGERRWRAANLAGLREVPCIELDIDERSIAEIALIENMQRKDLTVWEEADGLAALAKIYGYKHEEIAKKISKSRTTVTESMSIAGIPEEIREKCRAAGISAKSTLLEIARQFDDRAMLEFVENISSRALSREEIRSSARPGAKPAAQASSKPARQQTPAEFYAAPPAAVGRAAAGSNVFTFASELDDFSLEIRFAAGAYSKKDVLQALKQAFESVKANRAE